MQTQWHDSWRPAVTKKSLFRVHPKGSQRGVDNNLETTCSGQTMKGDARRLPDIKFNFWCKLRSKHFWTLFESASLKLSKAEVFKCTLQHWQIAPNWFPWYINYSLQYPMDMRHRKTIIQFYGYLIFRTSPSFWYFSTFFCTCHMHSQFICIPINFCLNTGVTLPRIWHELYSKSDRILMKSERRVQPNANIGSRSVNFFSVSANSSQFFSRLGND